VSAITRTEFDAALAAAIVAYHQDPEGPAWVNAMRAFFAALPEDVKLMRREPTQEMFRAFNQAKPHPRGELNAVWDAAPASLPKEGE
jgi:hypothetical protein